ncbi:MAG: hypothetical protein RTU92_08560 [Candidatus Thorarchaeota archaeon]
MKESPDLKISKEMQSIAKYVSRKLDKVAGKHMAFSLLVFNVEEHSRMNYCSNCDREEVYSALKALLESWEQGMPDIKAHNVQ